MMNPVPSIPILPSGGSGKLFLGIGLLIALVLIAKKPSPSPASPRN